jgi:two-component system chemotaxis sensor kinase CheA
MNDLQKHFLAESISNLEDLQRRLSAGYSEELRREAFRAVHTIKGTAQTFGLQDSALIAHKLEQTLSAKDFHNEKKPDILAESISDLIAALKQKKFSGSLLSKSAAEQRTENFSVALSSFIGDDFINGFSEQEKSRAAAALTANQDLFCAEVAFAASRFAEDYKNLRRILDENGEVIAAFPGAKTVEANKISFEIYFASAENLETLQKLGAQFSAVVTAKTAVSDLNINLQGVLSQVAKHGQNLAEKLGKDAKFAIMTNDLQVSPATLKTIFDALLHLIRNAVDHGIERRGKIEIEAKYSENEIVLKISDNGRGVDLEKIRSVAAERNLSAKNAALSDEDILNLIFEPEFSTAKQISEISGRGVGLDAVKNLVENANGRISVKSEKDKGTSFEIFLPNNISPQRHRDTEKENGKNKS